MYMEIFSNLWYMCRRFKLASTLNFVGLTVAFASFYIFMTQVDYGRSYNRGIDDYERVYRLEQTSFSSDFQGYDIYCSRPHIEGLAQIPQIEAVSGFMLYPFDWECQKNGSDMMLQFVRGCQKPLSVFSPKCLDGKLEWTDEDCDGVLIPASMAMNYFGEVQVAGRYMYGGGDSTLVRGVFEDFPANSSVRNIMYTYWKDDDLDSPNNLNYGCFIKLREDADLAEVEELVHESEYKMYRNLAAKYAPSEEDEGYFEEIMSKRKARLTPIDETFFSGLDSNFDKGNKGMMLVLELACLLVIVVAGINFLNFTLAESPMRIKSVNTRRVLGKDLWTQRMELIGETTVISLLACVVGMVIAYLLAEMPEMQELVTGSIAISDNLQILACTFVVSVLLGIASGVYPSVYVTSFAPALVLKGSFGLSPKGKRLRTMLVAFQLAVSFFMVCYIGVLYLQSHYIFNSDYGFDKDQLYYTVLDNERQKRFDEIEQKLRGVPGVEAVSRSANIIGSRDIYSQWGRHDDEHTIFFNAFVVDWRYLRSMGIEVIEGRDFSEHDGDVYIINEAARKQWDWVEMDKQLLKDDMPVVGVCENVRFGSMRQDNASKPLAFIVPGEKMNEQGWGWGGGPVVNIRVAAGTDRAVVRKQLEDCVNEVGGHGEIGVSFLDQQLEQTYKEEFRFISQVVVFSIVCLLITLIGVFCLTMFETEYRRKEIGLRKIMGSTVGGVLTMLCRRYAVLIVASFVLSAPVAWYFGAEWLNNFAERTEIHWWLFPVSLMIVGGVTILTVIIQSWKVANDNPINSIKTE